MKTKKNSRRTVQIEREKLLTNGLLSNPNLWFLIFPSFRVIYPSNNLSFSRLSLKIFYKLLQQRKALTASNNPTSAHCHMSKVPDVSFRYEQMSKMNHIFDLIQNK